MNGRAEFSDLFPSSDGVVRNPGLVRLPSDVFGKESILLDGMDIVGAPVVTALHGSAYRKPQALEA